MAVQLVQHIMFKRCVMHTCNPMSLGCNSVDHLVAWTHYTVCSVAQYA